MILTKITNINKLKTKVLRTKIELKKNMANFEHGTSVTNLATNSGIVKLAISFILKNKTK